MNDSEFDEWSLNETEFAVWKSFTNVHEELWWEPKRGISSDNCKWIPGKLQSLDVMF